MKNIYAHLTLPVTKEGLRGKAIATTIFAGC